MCWHSRNSVIVVVFEGVDRDVCVFAIEELISIAATPALMLMKKCREFSVVMSAFPYASAASHAGTSERASLTTVEPNP